MMRDIPLRSGALPAGSLKMLLGAWFVSELIALVLVVKVLGLGGAILLTALSSVLGIVLLRRMGLDAAQRLRGALTGGAREGALLDGTVAAFGALLLILPGFVTDLVGLALATPSVRHSLLTRLGGGPVGPAKAVRRNGPPDVIDLPPSDWSVVETPRRS